MRFDLKNSCRKTIRLRDYDYSQAGAYFVTICTYNKECLFGNIIDGDIVLSPMGKIAYKFWLEIPLHFKSIKLDEFIIMPNHIHGIILITDQGRGVKFNAPTRTNNYYSRISPQKDTLPVIIRTYKSVVTHYGKQNGYEYFKWQRAYYEHVIRNEDDLNQVRE